MASRRWIWLFVAGAAGVAWFVARAALERPNRTETPGEVREPERPAISELFGPPATDALDPRSERRPGPATPAVRILLRGRVEDVDGRPVAGAEILAAAPRHPQRASFFSVSSAPDPDILLAHETRPADMPVTRATSGEGGAFELAAERGELHVAVRRPRFVGLDLLCLSDAEGDALDLGALTLAPAATLRGRVVDETGRAIAGARIQRAERSDLPDGLSMDWSGTVLARSGADGGFTLDALALGRTWLELHADGFAIERHELFVETLEPPAWEVVLARSAPITGRVRGAPPDTRVEVVVLSDAGAERPVACAEDGRFRVDGLETETACTLEARRSTGTPPRWEAITARVSVRAGAEGVELTAFAPSGFHVELVDSATHEPLTDAHLGLFLDGWEVESAHTHEVASPAPGGYDLTVLLAAADGTALLVAHPGHQSVVLGIPRFAPGEVQDFGTVALDRLPTRTLRVVEENSGEPLSDLLVSAGDEGGDEGGCLNALLHGNWPARSDFPSVWRGRTDVDGLVQVPLARGRTHWISVEDEAYVRTWLSGVEPGPSADVLELRTQRGAAISVLVLDEATRRPVPREPVSWRGPEEECTWVETDGGGRARFERLAPGRGSHLLMLARHPEARAEVRLPEVGSVSEVVLLRPDEPRRLTGTVTDHGVALSGAMVEVGSRSTFTDLEGRYVFEDPARGRQFLVITHPRFGPVSGEEIEVDLSETRVDVELGLVPVRGRVLDERGAPVEGADVLVARWLDGYFEPLGTHLGGKGFRHATTLADGAFAFPGVRPEDELFLVAEAEGFRIARVGPLAFQRVGSALEAMLVLQPAVALEVRLEGWDPDAVALCEVRAVWRGKEELVPEDREQVAEFVREVGGAPGLRRRFERLLPGPWTIAVEPLLGSGPARGTALEIELDPQGNAPVVLRP